MKGQLQVTTPEEYLARLEEPRKSDIAALDALIRKHAPALQPYIQSGMLGYGPFHYQYGSGREGDWCRIALASNAAYISLYAMAADKDGYVAERFKKRLPKASIGKSCVRFKRVSDLDLSAVAELIEITARTGFGLEERRASKKAPAAKKASGAKKAPVKTPVKKAPTKKGKPSSARKTAVTRKAASASPRRR